MRQRLFLILFASALLCGPARAAGGRFELLEASIGGIHEAMRSGRLTCRGLVEQYLRRIAAFDRQGPKLNAIIALDPRALQQADDLDARLRRGRRMPPLHCVPVIVKDNFDVAGLPTTAGSSALAGSVPSEDAAAVSKLRESGALVLAKANLHEFALAGMTDSSLGGQTLNPYDLTRTPGGSSGGTGAAVAAGFGAVGMGSDTMNSIRSPSSANSLVGIRPTRGLISRAGVVPVSATQDAVGPITRTVADGARLLDALAGYDPRDPVTAFSVGQTPKASYASFLDKNGLKGARLGVLETFFGAGPEHREVDRVSRQALAVLRRQGAELVSVADPALETGALLRDVDVQKYEFRSGLDAYLGSLGPKAPMRSLADVVASGKFLKSSEPFLTTALGYERGTEEPDYKDRRLKIEALRLRVAELMAKNRLDALVYPHQKRLAVLITEATQADRNGILAALTGYPAITVPAGFSKPTQDAPLGVPVGIEFLGRPWAEPLLLKLAYGFEQATHARRPPRSTPALARDKVSR